MTEKTFDEEVMEVINDTELPNQDWIKKYGDKFYWRVIREIVLQRIDSCPVKSTLTYFSSENSSVTFDKMIKKSDLHRVFGVEGKQKRR
jgi:hypothetical protein